MKPILTSGQAWQEDPWCRYLPELHRLLADPDVQTRMPCSYFNLEFEQTCAWWETLRYLLRTLVGWRDIPAGLAWWYAAGRPSLNDPHLMLVLARWNTREELDYFAAREWETGGYSGSGDPTEKWMEGRSHEPSPGWWVAFHQRPPPPATATGPVTPAIEAQLNERQKKIMIAAQKVGFTTSGWCQKTFGVVRDTANRDLSNLVQHGLLKPVGKGRSARYVLENPV